MDNQNQENIQKNLEQMQIMGQVGENDNTNKKEQEDNKVTDLTDEQKAQKLISDNKKEQEKVVRKQVDKE